MSTFLVILVCVFFLASFPGLYWNYFLLEEAEKKDAQDEVERPLVKKKPEDYKKKRGHPKEAIQSFPLKSSDSIDPPEDSIPLSEQNVGLPVRKRRREEFFKDDPNESFLKTYKMDHREPIPQPCFMEMSTQSHPRRYPVEEPPKVFVRREEQKAPSPQTETLLTEIQEEATDTEKEVIPPVVRTEDCATQTEEILEPEETIIHSLVRAHIRMNTPRVLSTVPESPLEENYSMFPERYDRSSSFIEPSLHLSHVPTVITDPEDPASVWEDSKLVSSQFVTPPRRPSLLVPPDSPEDIFLNRSIISEFITGRSSLFFSPHILLGEKDDLSQEEGISLSLIRSSQKKPDSEMDEIGPPSPPSSSFSVIKKSSSEDEIP